MKQGEKRKAGRNRTRRALGTSLHGLVLSMMQKILEVSGKTYAEVVEEGFSLLNEELLSSPPDWGIQSRGTKRQKVIQVPFDTWENIDRLWEEREKKITKTAIVELCFIAFAEANASGSGLRRNVILQGFSDRDLINELKCRNIDVSLGSE